MAGCEAPSGAPQSIRHGRKIGVGFTCTAGKSVWVLQRWGKQIEVIASRFHLWTSYWKVRFANVSHGRTHGWSHCSEDGQQLLKLRQYNHFQDYAQTYGHIEKLNSQVSGRKAWSVTSWQQRKDFHKSYSFFLWKWYYRAVCLHRDQSVGMKDILWLSGTCELKVLSSLPAPTLST